MTDLQTNPEKPLNVAQIIGRLSVGGAERHFVSLCNALTDCRLTAVLVSSATESPTLDAELSPSVATIHIPIRKRSIVTGIRRLAEMLEKSDCDVVHTHMFWPTLYGSLAARLARVPVVVTTEHGENRWKRFWHRWLERFLISRIADVRFCVSPEIRRRRHEDDGIPASKLEVVSNGTLVPELENTVSTDDGVVIGSVGRLVRQKNFPLFVRVIGLLRDRGYRIRAYIIGDGPERQDLERLQLTENLQDVVELPGFDTDTDGWYRRFDVYVNSSDEEGQPISVLEAMAYGLPVVACDVGAMRDTLEDGREGTIVPPGDAEKMLDALRFYLDNRDVATRHGEAARERVIRDFSIDAVAASYRQFYCRLLSAKATQSA